MFIVKEDLRTLLKMYPCTVLFVGVCMVFTILITMMGGYTKTNIDLLGGYERELINEGQFWRLLTYSIGHVSYLHFILNMIFIVILSRPIERALGKVKFILFFLFTSIFAAMIIHFFSTEEYGAGSSGFGYGLLGMYMYFMLKFKDKFHKAERQFIFMFTAIGFAMTLLIPSISFAGHAGGFIGGIIFSSLIYTKEQQVTFSA